MKRQGIHPLLAEFSISKDQRVVEKSRWFRGEGRPIPVQAPTLTLALRPDRYAKLRWHSATTGPSMQALIRAQIEKWLDSLPDPPGAQASEDDDD